MDITTITQKAQTLSLSAIAFASSRTWSEWVAYGVIAFVGYSLLQLLAIYTGDADLQVRAALARMRKSAFQGKTVWIVGASSGIGEALAYEVASRGATVILSARRVDRLQTVQQTCLARGSPQAHVYKLDVEAFDTHAKAVADVVRLVGKIDYLVNNAGRSQRGLVERTSINIDKEMFNLNVFGVFSLTKAALPVLLAQPEGAVICTTSSVAGKLGSPISATYSSTKHALQGFFDSLRMELGSRKIRVVMACPGPVQSEITLRAFTETEGKMHNDAKEEGTTRMTAERCAALMAAGMWAELPEVWIAPQPILLFTYVAQYVRWLYFRMGPGAGAKRVAAFKNGKSGYGSIQNVWSTLSATDKENGGNTTAGGHAKKA